MNANDDMDLVRRSFAYPQLAAVAAVLAVAMIGLSAISLLLFEPGAPLAGLTVGLVVLAALVRKVETTLYGD